MNHKFVRSNENPGSVINTDSSGLNAYKRRKKIFEEQNKKIEQLENKFDHVLTALQDISKKLDEKNK